METLSERLQGILDHCIDPKTKRRWSGKGLARAAKLRSESHVSMIINGEIKEPKRAVKEAIAAAAGASYEWLEEGKGPPPWEVVPTRDAPLSSPRLERDPAPAVDTEESPLGRALGQAFDPSRHTTRDIRAVEDAMGDRRELRDPDGDLLAAARQLLDAAAFRRKRGEPVDAASLALHIAAGKGALAAESHARRQGEHQADVAAMVARAEAELGDDAEGPDAAEVAKLRETAAKKGGRG